MIDAMRRAAAFRPFPMLPHVEQLIICESCVYLINLCPNTKMFGCVRFHTDRQGMHDSADFLEVIETAACLPKLTSLTACSAWVEPIVDHIHHHLPNLLELRLNPNNTPRPVGLEAMQRMVNKFRRIRIIGIDEIQYVIDRLPGTQQMLTYDWIHDRETKYTQAAQILLAGTLLYSGHPALEDIEIRWLCEEKKFKDWHYRCVAEHCQGATGVYRRDTENDSNAVEGVISDRWLSTHGAEMIDSGWHAVGKTW